MCQLISTTPSENDLHHVGLAQSQKSRRAAGTDQLEDYENIFLEKLIEEYGTDGVVSVSQLTELVNNIRLNVAPGPSHAKGHETAPESTHSPATQPGEAAGDGQGSANCTDTQTNECKTQKVSTS